MDFPPEFIITKTLKVGTIYKMIAPEMIETSEPHYFIVVAIHEQMNYMFLSTTNISGKFKYYNGKEDLDTLTNLSPNANNKLTKESYVDCNMKYVISKNQLVEKLKKEELKYTGYLTNTEYQKILNSMSLSKRLDLPKFIIPKEIDDNE